MTKHTLLATLISLGFAAPTFALGTDQTGPKHPASVNAREHRQASRIKEGVKDKQLTKGELDRLKAAEAAIRAEERVYRKSGGGLNAVERRRLEKDLNKSSKAIYRAKHNGRKRGGV